MPERDDISLLVGEGPVQNDSTIKEGKNLGKKKPKPKNTPKNQQKATNQTKKIDSINKLQHSQLPESIMVNRYMPVKTNSNVFFSSRMTLYRVY